MTRVRRRSQRGFTLIEVMVVVAIVAIITVSLASMSSSTGAASPTIMSDRVTGMISFARLRSESRRKIHQVQVTATSISVWESTLSGFQTPTTFELVQTMDVPSGVIVWSADSVSHPTSTGANPAQNLNLPFTINFKPDGQSTGGTIYLTDNNKVSKYRVFIYKTTGTALAREIW